MHTVYYVATFIGESMYTSLVVGDQRHLEVQWKSTAVFFGGQAEKLYVAMLFG